MGVLALKKARFQNIALLTKLGWNVITNKDNLWAKILRDKYLTDFSLSNWPKHRRASHTWKGIIHTRPHLIKRIKWSISDGLVVNLWSDWWCGDGPLINLYPSASLDINMQVRDTIDDNSSWNLDSIAHIIFYHTIEDILNTHINLYSHYMDKPK